MMNDDDFWHSTNQVGFDFGDLDNWSTVSNAFQKVGTIHGLEEFHSAGLYSCLENEGGLVENQGPSALKIYDSSSESVKAYIGQRDILKLNQQGKSSYVKTNPESTVKNMVLGLEYNLEHHKEMDEKIALLESAIKSHDGNAIIAVILFLRSTLRKSLFQHQIQQHPEAIHHYLHYLQVDQELDELSDMLLMIGNTEDAAILKYKAAIKLKDPESKIKKLENCQNTHFQLSSVAAVFTDSLSEHISLLRRQLPVEEDDARQEREGSNELFIMHPRKCSIIDVPVITTLYYCCIYHYNLGINNLASPVAIKKCHQLSDKQFAWTAISALAKLHRWPEIENLFLNKDWLGITKLKCCIGFSKAIPILADASAPPEIILKYMELVDNMQERLNLAKNYKFHAIVMKILMAMRDRDEFLIYQSELSPKSLEYKEVEEVLHSSNMKWRN